MGRAVLLADDNRQDGVNPSESARGGPPEQVVASPQSMHETGVSEGGGNQLLCYAPTLEKSLSSGDVDTGIRVPKDPLGYSGDRRGGGRHLFSHVPRSRRTMGPGEIATGSHDESAGR